LNPKSIQLETIAPLESQELSLGPSVQVMGTRLNRRQKI